MDTQGSLAHLLSSHSPVPVLMELAVSDLLWISSLTQSWSVSVLGLDWLPAPAPLELASSGPLGLDSSLRPTSVEFVASILLQPKVEIIASDFGPGFWFWPVYVNTGLSPLLQRSLAWSWSYKDLCLWPTASEFPGSDVPRTTEDLAQAYSLRGPRLKLRPAKVSSSCLFPLMSQTNVWTHRGPEPGLLPLRSQTHA